MARRYRVMKARADRQRARAARAGAAAPREIKAAAVPDGAIRGVGDRGVVGDRRPGLPDLAALGIGSRGVDGDGSGGFDMVWAGNLVLACAAAATNASPDLVDVISDYIEGTQALRSFLGTCQDTAADQGAFITLASDDDSEVDAWQDSTFLMLANTIKNLAQAR